MPYSGVSNSVIQRLPRYYRYLGDLKASGISRISSKALSEKMNLTASQIRQDLNCFGGFGQQGYGYNIDVLREEIGHILGIDAPKKAIIVGMGNLGKALAQHLKFENKGFMLIGLFDIKESLIGQMVRNIPIRSTSNLDEFCRDNKPEVAIITTPKEAAQSLSDQLVKLGVKGFLNFSHYDLTVNHPEITVENIHLGDKLLTLSYRLKEND